MADHQLSPSPSSASVCTVSLGSDASFYSPNQRVVDGDDKGFYQEKSADQLDAGYSHSLSSSPQFSGKVNSSIHVDLLSNCVIDEAISPEKLNGSGATDLKLDTVVSSFSQLDLKLSDLSQAENLWKFVDGMMHKSSSSPNIGSADLLSSSAYAATLAQLRAITGHQGASPPFQPRPMHETYAMNTYQAWSTLAHLHNGYRGQSRPGVDCTGPVMPKYRQNYPFPKHVLEAVKSAATDFKPDPAEISATRGEVYGGFDCGTSSEALLRSVNSTEFIPRASSSTVYSNNGIVGYDQLVPNLASPTTPVPSSPYSPTDSAYEPTGTPLSAYASSSSSAATRSSAYGSLASPTGTPTSAYGSVTSPTGTPSSAYEPTGTPGSAYGSLASPTGTPVSGYRSGYPVLMEAPQFSRKVFVGGLPPDIDEEEITLAFRRFGPLIVDWPHKADSKSYFPPKGYCFLLFQDEQSVQSLISSCLIDDHKLYWCVSSPTMKDKPVQIRPWNTCDSDFVLDGSQPLDPRKTIFVGGVPRPLRAVELAMIMDKLYGGVCYAGIDTDPELKYPKGAGRVAFSNQQSYISAISARFVQLQHCDIDKRVEVKPYVLDDQLCDECQGTRCGGKYAPFFCANVTCLQYYCETCWAHIHARPGREYHKPLVKEGTERPRSLPFRWY